VPPDDASSEYRLIDSASDLLNGYELVVSSSTAKRDVLKFVCN